MTIALARRYRPRRFADLLVQDHVAAALRGAVAKNRLGHGYLLTGPRGVGKTTAARILAMALNCEQRHPDQPGEPCGECSSCLKIWNGAADLDVVEIDAASNRGVDDARDLRERAMYAASREGHHKVYIVDEAHMLTREAWNALLKVLEEPPPGVVFVFATTEPQKIANTAAPVMSRLQRFDFRRIGPTAIQQRLAEVLRAEGLTAEDDALLLIARHADGGMRDALSVLDQCLSFGEGPLTAERVRNVLGLVHDDAYDAVLRAVAERRPGDLFPVMDRLQDGGADLVEFAGGLADLVRAVVMRHYGSEPEGLPDSTREVIARAAAQIGPEDAVRMLKLLGDAEGTLRRSASPRLVLETLLLRWAMLDRVVDLRALLGGGPPPPAPSLAAASPPPVPAPRVDRPAAPAAPVAAVPPPAPKRDAGAATPAATRGRTTEALVADWGEIVATANRQSQMLGQVLSLADPSLDGEVVVLTFGAASAWAQDGAARQTGAVETILSAHFGSATAIRITGGEEPARSKRSNRLSVEELRSERLTQLRGRDPALDAVAEALDLELVDEG